MVIAGLEQRILRISICATVSVALVGVVFGLYSGSLSIVFDGLFDAVDASMSLLSLLVSKLLVKEVSRRFQQGYWHMEPMVLALNASVLVCLCVYAFINSINSFMLGGSYLAFDMTSVYAFFVAVAAWAMYAFEKRVNQKVKSDLLALDIQSWFMSGAISSALFVAFIAGYLLQDTAYEYLTPYIDPLILAALSLCLIPAPAITVAKAFKQILMITPSDLDCEIAELMTRLAAKYRFEKFSHYVTQVGRGLFVEIHIVLPIEMDDWRVSDLDRLREQISHSIGREGPDRWLSIGFTRDERWL